jgi:hypothetical protein
MQMPVKLVNRKGKGTRAERELRHIFEKSGWIVVRSAGSLGPFDLVAIRLFNGTMPKGFPKTADLNGHCVLYINLKCNAWPRKTDVRKMFMLQETLTTGAGIMVRRNDGVRASGNRWECRSL